MQKKLIFYIILIIVILAAVFFSQTAYSRLFGQALISGVTDKASAYMAQSSVSVVSGAYSKLSDNIRSGGETIKNTVDQTKQKISDAGKNISNYFSGIKESILHPGENNNCPPTPTN